MSAATADHDRGSPTGGADPAESGEQCLKFTERGSVRVRVEALDREVVRPGTAALPALRFSIIDTGIGIPGEAVDSVFDPFHQIDSGLARHHEGSGLGLAICRRLASLMDGRIDLRSTEGVGSEFVLVLPQRGIRAMSRDILLIEDNENNRYLVRFLLEQVVIMCAPRTTALAGWPKRAHLSRT